MDYNEKTMKRECFCLNCKQYTNTTNVAPVCPHCYKPLITLINSVVIGITITGAVDNVDYNQFK